MATRASIVIDGDKADGENIESQTVTPAVQFSGVTIMAENVKTVEQKMDELSVTVDHILKYVEDTPALKNVGYVSGTGGKSDSNLKSFADFLTAIARRYHPPRMASTGARRPATTTATGELGGYLVPSDYQGQPVSRWRFSPAPSCGWCNVSPVSTQSGEWPVLDQFVANSGVGKTPSRRHVRLRHGPKVANYTETNPTFEMLQLACRDRRLHPGIE